MFGDTVYASEVYTLEVMTKMTSNATSHTLVSFQGAHFTNGNLELKVPNQASIHISSAPVYLEQPTAVQVIWGTIKRMSPQEMS